MTSLGRRIGGSYRARILLGYAVIVSLVAAAWGWSLYGPLTNAVVEQQQAHLQSVAQAGALVLARPDQPAADAVRQLVARTELRVTVVGSDGEVLADSHEDPTEMENHAGRPEIAAALDGRVGRATRASRTQGLEQMYVAVPATVDGHRAALRVSESLDRINAVAARARRTGLLLLAGAIAVSIFVTSRVAERAVTPVLRLAEEARRMASGDLTTPIHREAGDLGILSSALADLKGQLRSRVGALESERENLRSILDGLPDAVFLLEGGRISAANSAASDMFRAPVSGWHGRSLEDAGLPGSIVGATDRLSSAGGAEEIGDPTGRFLRLIVTPLPDGSASRLLLAVSDVTERARLDIVRRDFVANASHELKTPTAGIQLLAEAARTAAEDGDTEQALAFVRQIEGEAARLRHLVLDLLDLSRLETVPAAGAVTDLRAAADLSVSAHRRSASARGLTLELDTTAVGGEDVFASAETTDVAVLLDNLLDNAIQYTEHGSVRVRLEAADESVRIIVTDTGVGISAEDLPRVFERFYRVDRARTRGGGTGLGLALVKHIAERNGGLVAIDSAPGSGTEVRVRLPRAR